ncbi:MAG: hypothetical protein VX100_13290 [Pseudomonadota bacterium]|uniref:hypothetical protein n=1 Tax=Pseudoalteromonas TaxID=53246 RepID=UPI000C0B1E0A|nr:MULTISPECIES: hypothetical protein [Pseudoalteromonas]MAD89100.1 hypothetical protein [Pseudoalteromonas sp.]MEC8327035.1 hypothetical protein [Pseudomonadota bacterium]NKC17723.1 hypothetical protein [Pseudoalteromonas galatheae]TMO88914.1 hypothetical protein CWC15_00175 [Pseudoalteromonas spongiae]|tara:strand:- start:753 stop:1172 length:420 start_codon:yes stop_codon:yes gene_type:complete
MLKLFNWLKIVILTVLMTQHSYIIAKPMNCIEHSKEPSITEITQSKEHKYQSIDVSSHQHLSDNDNMQHSHTDKDCEKCKVGNCLCCEGGFCTSFLVTAYLSQEGPSYFKVIDSASIMHRISSPNSGIHFIPYRPPIIG